jgi:hypothetical protein
MGSLPLPSLLRLLKRGGGNFRFALVGCVQVLVLVPVSSTSGERARERNLDDFRLFGEHLVDWEIEYGVIGPDAGEGQTI